MKKYQEVLLILGLISFTLMMVGGMLYGWYCFGIH